MMMLMIMMMKRNMMINNPPNIVIPMIIAGIAATAILFSFSVFSISLEDQYFPVNKVTSIWLGGMIYLAW